MESSKNIKIIVIVLALVLIVGVLFWLQRDLFMHMLLHSGHNHDHSQDGTEQLSEEASVEDRSALLAADPVIEQVNLDTEFADFVAAQNPQEELGGHLVLTLVERETDTDRPVTEAGALQQPESFTYEVAEEDGLLTPVREGVSVQFPNKKDGASKYLVMGHPALTTGEWDNFHRLNVFEYTAQSGLSLLDTESSEVGDDEVVISRRMPRWSDDGSAFLYSAQVWPLNRDLPHITDLEYWRVYQGNEGSTEVSYVADGYNAVWALDNEYIIYVANDGLYAKRADGEGVEILILPVGTVWNHIAVSPTGDHIVITTPEETDARIPSFTVYRLSNEDGFFNSQAIKSFNLEDRYAQWPVFSPEGRYLAMVTQSYDVENQDNKIEIFDLTTESTVQTFSISDYYGEGSYISDWVATTGL